MNFLAHLYLSRHNDELMIGNFIADSVKGSSLSAYSPGIAKGIRMHRAIDSFTDSHPVFLNSVRRLRPRYHKYSGVIVDIYYDHFLARNWEQHAVDSLSEFTRKIHALLRANHHLFPPRSKHFMNYMFANEIPIPYATISGIEKVLQGMSRRAKFESGMDQAGKELLEWGTEFESEFNSFMPDVKEFTKQFNL